MDATAGRVRSMKDNRDPLPLHPFGGPITDTRTSDQCSCPQNAVSLLCPVHGDFAQPPSDPWAGPKAEIARRHREAMASNPREPLPSNPLRIEFLSADVVQIEGVKYTCELFRDLGLFAAVGDCFQIAKREDGTVWLRSIPRPADVADVLPDMDGGPCPHCGGSPVHISGHKPDCSIFAADGDNDAR